MVFLIIGLIAIVSFFLSVYILYGLSKLFKLVGVTYKKTLIAMVLSAIASVIASIIFGIIGLGFIGSILSLVVNYFVFAYFYKKYYQSSWARSLGIFASNIGVGILIALFVAVPIRVFLFEPFVISGQSMSPHINSGSYLVVEKYDKNFKRDDVMVFTMASSTTKLVKRVIGLPTETVVIKDGQILINGSVLNDPFISTPVNGSTNLTLGTNQYFVLGDNLSSSVDSRTIGPVNSENVVGKVMNP